VEIRSLRGSSLVVTGQQDRTIRPEVKPRARTNGSGGRAEPVRAAVRDHYVGRKKYLSRISTGRRRSDGGDPGVAADHRSASVLAFLKDGGGRPRIVGGDRPEHDVLLRTQGRSTDGGLAVSRRRKPPLVLPRTLSGERRKGRCFAQPPEPGPLPHRGPQVILWGETEKALLSGRDARAQIPPTSGKKFSPLQGAVGHPLERQLQSLATHGMCLYAKNPSVKGSRPAIGPSMQSDSGLVPSSS